MRDNAHSIASQGNGKTFFVKISIPSGITYRWKIYNRVASERIADPCLKLEIVEGEFLDQGNTDLDGNHGAFGDVSWL